MTKNKFEENFLTIRWNTVTDLMKIHHLPCILYSKASSINIIKTIAFLFPSQILSRGNRIVTYYLGSFLDLY